MRKAAILLLAIDQSAAAMLLQKLTAESVEEVTRELASMGEVTKETRDGVLKEFYDMALAQSWINEGGLDYAKSLLRQSLDPKEAERILQQISQQVRKTPFSFLQKAESQNLLTFIQDEHPQTIALIVSHMGYHKASEILAGLPGPKQIEVVKRVANMEQTNPEVIAEVERGLEARLHNLLSQSFEKIGGVETVAEMLNLTDRTTEKGIMEGLEAEDPDLVEQIRRLMFVFEDIMLVDDRGYPGSAQRDRQRRVVFGAQDRQRRPQRQDIQEHVRACVAAYQAKTWNSWGPFGCQMWRLRNSGSSTWYAAWWTPARS